MNNVILYLIGFAGTGKYTIAKELAKHGYKIIDNHLINNPIFSLLDLDEGTPIPDRAWNAIEKIRQVILNFIAQQPPANYVFTNVILEDDEDHADGERHEDDWIDQRADDLFAQSDNHFLVLQKASKDAFQIAGALTGAKRRRIDWWKDLAVRGEGIR